MRPYRIAYGESFKLDLSPYTTEGGLYKSGSVVLPEGFSYEIKGVKLSSGGGSLEDVGGGVYSYAPAQNTPRCEIKVTLGITKLNGAFKVDDVELVIELEQTHELNKSLLERTVYTFDGQKFAEYSTAAAAYEAEYAGFTEKREEDNLNRVQNGNAEIWEPKPASQAFIEIRGKLFASDAGNYRVALRGRHSVALYISTDGGVSYFKGADINHNTNKNDWWSEENGYCDLTGLKAGSWIYFKAVLRVDYASAFIGVGFGRFEAEDDSDAKVTLTYANAYRCGYQFPQTQFTSDYLFVKSRPTG